MKKTSAIFSILFLASLAASFYTLYQLPAYLMQSQVIDLVQLENAQAIFNQTNAILILSFALASIAIGYLWLHRSGSADTVAANLSAEVSETLTAEALDQNSGSIEATPSEAYTDLINYEGDEKEVFTEALTQLCRKTEASLAAAYRTSHTEEYAYLELFASYAYSVPEGTSVTYRFGEGLAGQVAKQGNVVSIDDVPSGYIKVLSGLGQATPTHLMICPLKCDEAVVGVVEIASFTKFTEQQKDQVAQVLDRLALKLANTDNVSLLEATP
jgi:transcriptional regulator with GAF, ATPase, and Fis domain